MNKDLAAYYARRAATFEQIYHLPERRSDLQVLRERIGNSFPGNTVLEIACGTGYWTHLIAARARSILALDISEEMLRIARQKKVEPCAVAFRLTDAYTLADVTGSFDAGFCGFWWSHVPASRIGPFLSAFHAKLHPGARVIFLDNRFVEGSSTPIYRRDEEGNTYQIRKLEDGTEHEVLKNFPTGEEIQQSLAGFADYLKINFLDYYWLAEYTVSR